MELFKGDGTAPSLNPEDTKTKVKALPLTSAASIISLSSSSVGTLSRAYRLIVGNIRFIFFQLRMTSFISRNNLTALSQLFTVPAEISPRSALARSDDRNAIILFSASAGLLFAKSTKASGDLASIPFRKPISLLSYGSRVA